MRSANKFLFYALWIISGFARLVAQDSEPGTNLEKYVENTETNTDYTDLSDQEEKLLRNPVNLNIATEEQLLVIPQLTPRHIRALLLHRQQYGKLNSIYELQVIEGFDPELILSIKLFVHIFESLSLSNLQEQVSLKSYQHEMALISSRRLEKSIGYTLDDSDNNAFLGSPYRNAMRYKASLGTKLSFGFNAEKDDGENWRQYFLSPYFQLTLPGKLRQLLIGDFQAAFGQGLCFGSGLSFGKSPFVLNIMRRQNGLRPSRALNENEFLRGIGCTYQLSKNLDLTAFYSLKRIDATGEDSIGSGFTGLLNTGNYRNSPELSKKGQIKRSIIGSNLHLDLEKLQVGATFVQTHYSEQQVAGEGLYRLYGNSASMIRNFGSDYKLFHHNLLFFGEVAMNPNIRSLSLVNGMIASLDKNLDISILYRRYSKDYIPSITNAFGETQDMHNETGLYVACSFTPAKNYKINAYSDIYRFNWLRYQVDGPSQGRDMMVELQYSLRRRFSWYARYRNEQKQKNEPGVQVINRLETVKRQLLRFHLEMKVSPSLTLKSRLEQVWHQRQFGETTHGMLIFQDLQVQVHKKVKLLARLMVFDVEDYNSRVFAFENDVMYSFSVPAFQDRGTRFYILCKYKMNKNIYLCFRFARSSYENIQGTGSGQDRINSNRTTDTKVQLLWTL